MTVLRTVIVIALDASAIAALLVARWRARGGMI